MKYKVGDKVKHKFKPEWNIGTIVNYSLYDEPIPEYINHGYEEESLGSLVAPYIVLYPCFKWDKVDRPFEGEWWTAEENLILVEE
jgi:hypothetical protein